MLWYTTDFQWDFLLIITKLDVLTFLLSEHVNFRVDCDTSRQKLYVISLNYILSATYLWHQLAHGVNIRHQRGHEAKHCSAVLCVMITHGYQMIMNCEPMKLRNHVHTRTSSCDCIAHLAKQRDFVDLLLHVSDVFSPIPLEQEHLRGQNWSICVDSDGAGYVPNACCPCDTSTHSTRKVSNDPITTEQPYNIFCQFHLHKLNPSWKPCSYISHIYAYTEVHKGANKCTHDSF